MNNDPFLLSHQDMDWGRSSCFLFELLGETAPQMFHNASIWLTLVLAAQRYIYICQATRSVTCIQSKSIYSKTVSSGHEHLELNQSDFMKQPITRLIIGSCAHVRYSVPPLVWDWE